MQENQYFKFIQKEIESNEIIIFIKGKKENPSCGFSSKAITILEHFKIRYKSIDVLENIELKEALKEYSEWPTIPQLYIKNVFIGGGDILYELFKSGELAKILEPMIENNNKKDNIN